MVKQQTRQQQQLELYLGWDEVIAGIQQPHQPPPTPTPPPPLQTQNYTIEQN